MQIALILYHVELEKSLRETEDYLNEMPGVLAVFDLDEAPHYSSFCQWEQEYRMRELRRLLRASAEQAGWSGEAAIDASGFQRDQTSYHYRDRVNYSLQSLKKTILIDVNSLAIKDVHFTTQKVWDGHIGMQVFRRNADDLLSVAADKAFHNWITKYEFYALGVEPIVLQRGLKPLTLGHNALIRAKGYSQRWIAETSYSTTKRSLGDAVQALG